jgi:uncharacterized SAM-dependent methyltransferase
VDVVTINRTIFFLGSVNGVMTPQAAKLFLI